ncbi:TlpA family protein disulfide reductase [Allorhizocola rhizosphaerae]|uniref:TlpA family protein disulfide reductase n=1 Tax=Allorhizocola rhizosphaerae TaxID=1872709 RepID=UPI000E3E161F|nr:TlpA disulfide reductase family protein [Allorhizocola rhizosphaerae]
MRAALLAVLLVLSGCTAPAPQPGPDPNPAPSEAVHFAECAFEAGESKLPDIELPCFTGGQPVRLSQVKGPLVINFWASWCPPCLVELPAFQRLADNKTVPVIGVASLDRRSESLARAQRVGFRFPMLDDPEGRLLRQLGFNALPLTVFVDAQGNVTTYHGPALTDDTLAAQVRERIGVA